MCTMDKLPLPGIAVIAFLCISTLTAFSQSHKSFRLNPLTSYDSLRLSQIPPLTLSQETNRRLLPYAVDNSELPWLRPIFQQDGFDCGQAASVGYVFTYEINRLRGLPADIPENQYATWFSFNFINQGMDEVGVSYYETFEILKYAGNPTVAEYGGMSAGGITRWMNGYDLYYSSMHNRIQSVSSVKVNTPDGIQTMKNWLYDHGDGSASGSIGCFYASLDAYFYFPPNVPEAGKMVIPLWGPEASHAMSIVGYNDSIRWDYNNDGQYTNDLDIDGDGSITVRDWEIGGFKIANSYGDEWFGDEGFAYIMYKSVADQYGQGGIWDNTVVVMHVKDNQQPQLTAKVSLAHECRNKLSISAGVSSDPEATEPEHIMHFPMFDFQGGCFPLHGDTVTDPIELGLDISLLLAYVNPGEPARYFLMIQENDPQGTASGILESFSIIDYTNGVNEISSQVTSMPLANNSITEVFVNAGINFYPVEVMNDTIMPIELYSGVALQMEATGGTPPYSWHLADDYQKQQATAVMQQIDAVKLELSSVNDGKALVHLPFPFPYYGVEYTEIYATVDGYLMFEDAEIPWPYYLEGRTYFIETPMIAAALCNPFQVKNSTHGIWYEEDDESVIFRWSMGVWGMTNGAFNATVRLYNDGRIEVNYGEWNIPVYVERYAGISNGDGENYEIISYAPDFSPSLNQLLIYTPADLFSGIGITPDGLLSAQVHHPLDNMPLTVCVSDKNNIRDYKTFIINTTGLQMELEIKAGGDTRLEFGEEALLNLIVTNHNSFTVGATAFTFISDDPFITDTDGTADVNSILPGQTITISDAFSFVASNDLPDLHQIPVNLNAIAIEGDWTRHTTFTGYRPVTKVKRVLIAEPSDGVPDPGETVEVIFDIINSGGGKLLNAYTILSASDPDVTILTSPIFNDTLAPHEITQLVYQVQISGQAPVGHMMNLHLEISGDHAYYYSDSVSFYVGKAAENFEAGDFEWLGWESGGDTTWFVDTGTSYEGNNSARSGVISDNQMTWMRLYWDAAFDDSITFWYKVESQYYYDYLRFNILQGERGRWSGFTGWKRAAVAIPAGPNMFTWMYRKNSFYAEGQDCAWVDYIIFPTLNGTISVENTNIVQPKLWLYPNPVNDRLIIKYSLPESSSAVISISDIHGRCVFMHDENVLPEGEYTLTPALGNLKAGTYTVRLQTGKGTTERKMIRSGN